MIVAVVGPSGAGKSTTFQLLLRFYDPQQGTITLDGVEIRSLHLHTLRNAIGIVPQDTVIFAADAMENIRYSRVDATDEEIIAAARMAAAHEFIEKLPLGYDTLLHENGGNLSGGQRQRLALARAILLDPAILILDDPTAAVDAGTEHEILEAMDRVMAGRTTFIVAHRFSTVRRADRIVVLERGRIAAIGTHEELSRQPGYYRDAILAESGKEVAA